MPVYIGASDLYIVIARRQIFYAGIRIDECEVDKVNYDDEETFDLGSPRRELIGGCVEVVVVHVAIADLLRWPIIGCLTRHTCHLGDRRPRCFNGGGHLYVSRIATRTEACSHCNIYSCGPLSLRRRGATIVVRQVKVMSDKDNELF